MEQEKNVKEVDLIELFVIIGRGIKNVFVKFFKLILFIFLFGLRRIHYIALFVIAGGAAGLLLFSATQRYFSSNLIAQPNGISAEEMATYINDLNTFCKKSNIPALSYALSLPDSISKKIKSIEAFHYIDVNHDEIGDIIDFNKTYNPNDTNQHIDQLRIYLKVEVYDNKAFSNVRTGIFNYISQNPYLLKLNEIRKNELSELIDNSEKEIKKLDSLQNVVYFKKDNELKQLSTEKFMFLSEKDKQMFYRDKMALLKQKQQYIKEYELATEPITVIKDFTQLSIEENTKGKYIWFCAIWSGIIGYFLLLLLKYYKKILDFSKTI